MTRRLKHTVLSAVALLLVSSCATHADYHQPSLPLHQAGVPTSPQQAAMPELSDQVAGPKFCRISEPEILQLELITFAYNTNYDDASEVCWNIGGVVADITTPALNQRAVALLHKAGFAPGLYAGALMNLTDSQVEGSWRWASGATKRYSNWPQSEPNGGRGANCAGIELARGGHADGWWNDISCEGGGDAYPAVFCSLTVTPMQEDCVSP